MFNRKQFQFSFFNFAVGSGLLVSVAFVAWGFLDTKGLGAASGGVLFGWLGDKIGRARATGVS